MRMLILSYMLSYPMFVPNFEILGAVVAEKSFPMYDTGVRVGRKEKKKVVKRSFSIVVFFYTKILQSSVGVYKI